MNPSPVSSREELDEDLEIVSGEIPSDLAGHTLMIGPAGREIDHAPTPLLQGDGMIYRVDWGRGRARLKTRLVVTPCLAAERGVALRSRFSGLRFLSAGLLRMSPRLGVRNLANTALLPFDFGDGLRLLVTYDGGRPMEVDPVSLEVVTPVGALDEWRSFLFSDRVFPAVLSTAHPVADPHTRQLFSVNYARSLASVTSGTLARGARHVRPLVDALASASFDEAYVDIVRWAGVGRLERWRLVDGSGAPVTIHQSVHQIAVTREHVLVMDTGMKVTPTQTLGLGGPHALARALRDGLTTAHAFKTPLWIVRRADLVATSETVRAVRAELPFESIHFVADYEERGSLLRIHVGHNAAMDVAEWIRPFDVNHYTGEPMPPELDGVPCVAPMDVSRIATYSIDSGTGALVAERVAHSDALTWGIALYAAPELCTHAALPAENASMTWSTTGFAPALLTRFIHELYTAYPSRAVSLEAIEALGLRGRPACLFRTSVRDLAIEDSFEVGGEAAIGGVQHAPSTGRGDGYITAAIATATRREIRILHANDLARGPVCRLAHRRLRFGMTLHAAWLPALEKRTSSYGIDIREDHGSRARGAVADLLERSVYPRFPAPRRT